MILLWWRSSGTPPPPPPAKSGGGGPPPPARRRFVYDVFHSGRTVRRPATAETISTPAPKTAVRVVVENQPSEPKARKAAKVAAKAQRAGTLQVVSVAQSAQQLSNAQQVVGGIVQEATRRHAAETAAVHQAQEEELIISILFDLGEL
jgi:hypothetical protein